MNGNALWRRYKKAGTQPNRDSDLYVKKGAGFIRYYFAYGALLPRYLALQPAIYFRPMHWEQPEHFAIDVTQFIYTLK